MKPSKKLIIRQNNIFLNVFPPFIKAHRAISSKYTN